MKYLFFLFVCTLLISCDPCSDCGEPLLSEPTVDMVFIYQDSIGRIDQALEQIEFNDSALTANTDALDTLRERLTAIELGLDTMSSAELEEEQTEILELIVIRETDSTFYEALAVSSDSVSQLNTNRSDLNSGLIEVSSIRIPEVNASLPYFEQDSSAESWPVPLSFEETFSMYEVWVQGEQLLITLAYETYTEVDAERNVRVRAENIAVIETTGVDSLINCEQNCVDGAASFTFYF